MTYPSYLYEQLTKCPSCCEYFPSIPTCSRCGAACCECQRTEIEHKTGLCEECLLQLTNDNEDLVRRLKFILGTAKDAQNAPVFRKQAALVTIQSHAEAGLKRLEGR